MRKLLAAAIVSLLVSSPAVAQDWDRWFVGFDAGYIWRSEVNPVNGNVDSSGATLNLLAGHWWHIGRATVGFDVGVAFGGPRLENIDRSGWSTTYQDMVTTSLRAKVGVPTSKLLLYLAAGPQLTIRSDTFQWMSLPPTTLSRTHSGLVVALGLEGRISPNWSAKAEVGTNYAFIESPRSHNAGWSGKIGVNYYFD